VGFEVEMQEVVKTFGSGPAAVTALDRVSLTVEAASVVALMGPSGSGKSTLLHLVGAMDAADSGRVLVGGRGVTALAPAERAGFRRTVGFVFQRFHLLPALTVLDNVAAPLLPYHTDFDKHERAALLLDAVGLARRARAMPRDLSGGEQQRVAIARALVNDPGLILADEPTGNLDSATGVEVIELLLRARDERKTTVVVATHNTAHAARCDRVVRLHDGRLRDDLRIDPAVEPALLLKRIGRPYP
jgi:putative ABC transport system ATP-binding protein